jgi:hypothetical protein
MSEAISIEQIGEELISLLGTEKQVTPFSRRYRHFGLADAYEIVGKVGKLRLGQGEKRLAARSALPTEPYGLISAFPLPFGTTSSTRLSAMPNSVEPR